MRLHTYPEDEAILRTPCVGVEKVTPELVQIAKDAYQLMREHNGIGISAPQFGMSIKLIVIEDHGYPLVLFNPTVIQKSKDTQYKPEACLSFPGLSKLIRRPDEVTVKYRDVNNAMKYEVFKGLQAQVIVHEIEHLFSKLLIDN